MTMDEKLARMRTHRNSIFRYRRLLKTELTEQEQEFIRKRLSEEESVMESLRATTFSIAFKDPPSAGISSEA